MITASQWRMTCNCCGAYSILHNPQELPREWLEIPVKLPGHDATKAHACGGCRIKWKAAEEAAATPPEPLTIVEAHGPSQP